MTDKYVAIELTSLEVVDFASYIKPDILEMDFENELKFNFLVLGFPRKGEVSIVRTAIFEKHFSHIENEGPKFRFKLFVKNPPKDDDPLRKTFIKVDE